MITDQDIKKMKKVFATKDDLKSFATKDDLKPIYKGFDQMNTKLDGTNKRIDETNKKLDGTNKRLDDTNKKLDGTNKRLDDTNTRLDGTNKKLDDLTEYVIPALGSVFRWTDDIHRALIGGKRTEKHIPEN